MTFAITVSVPVLIEAVDFMGVTPPAFQYDSGEITKTAMITSGASRIGYVGFCAATREWLGFYRDGSVWSGVGKTRAEAVQRFVAYR